MEDKGGVLLVVVLVLCAAAVVGVLILGTPEARSAAKAAEIQAQAAAEAARIQAETNAAAERAALREAARQAGHERTVEMVPFVVLIIGGIGLCLVVLLVFWDLRTHAAPLRDDRQMLSYLQRMELAQAERDREMWHVLAQVCRVRLVETVDR